ncbi:MAG: exonuclease SbcCD subunit D [Anaerolineaceae bacterium]|nr:exonuclease SbcCD subunit D [Anaerolineaceae bacterium]
MLKILHFADAHIDMANYGQHDPESGLPARVVDFLKSLDSIVSAAIEEKADLVVFCGDAYRDRSPAPTFQREWDKRVLRLSKAGIQTVLLTGNHDIAPAALRAHAMQEMETLEIPYIHVASKPRLFTPEQLGGLPLYLVAVPWITRARVIEGLVNSEAEDGQGESMVTEQLQAFFEDCFRKMDPTLPVVLAAHASIEGAEIGQERMITVGKDLMFAPGLVRDPRFDYVALGHIHKFQDLNLKSYPPVVYPGSIERVDFGEIHEEKGFVFVCLEKGKTRYEFRKLATRPFIDRKVFLETGDAVLDKLVRALPSEKEAENAIARLSIYYPKELETQIDEAELRRRMKGAFQFNLSKHAENALRTRLSEGQETSLMSAEELLDVYWQSSNTPGDERETLVLLAKKIIDEANGLRG